MHNLEDDLYFGAPFIDTDEWRDIPRRHRYIHGGFEGTETLFAFYFPTDEEYRGRFIHMLQGGTGGSEHTAYQSVLGETDMIDFAAQCGAFYVESNQGHVDISGEYMKMDPSITSWRASAQTARYASKLATEIYGEPPHHAYLLGGSGGGLRAVVCMENTDGVWDGGVPYIAGPCALNGPSVVINAARALGPKVHDVIDAMAPGGSGDPFSGLNAEQREALALFYRVGLPRGSEFALKGSAMDVTIGMAILTSTLFYDPTLVDDFWSIPGHIGADGGLVGSIIDVRAKVKKILTRRDLGDNPDVAVTQGFWGQSNDASPLGLILDGPVNLARIPGSRITVLSGAEEGQKRVCIATAGDALLVGLHIGEKPLEKIAVGDELAIDNRAFLTFCYGHRHQVDRPLPSTAALCALGRPIYPQRPINQATTLVGVGQTGRFSGKMIFVNNMFDTNELASNAADYIPLVKQQFGAEIGDRFRLWLNDNTTHIGPTDAVSSTYLIPFMGSVQQAVRDVISWVEDDTPPPASTGFHFTPDEGMALLPMAETRLGVQPVVTAMANGAVRAEVAVGEAVRFEVKAEAPPGAGTIIAVEWDFDGAGLWPIKHAGIDGNATRVGLSVTHRFDRPGTYFPSVRVTAHREGDVEAVHRRQINLARVRVVVS
ncbi:MAG: hypothetical protein JWM91_2686 [Rhodospirillales bacterium]|nr:hypothetical protein [Rhodospirillales bacterium]